jgi:hypothetical protein
MMEQWKIGKLTNIPAFQYSNIPNKQRKEAFRVADQMEEKVTFDGKKVKVLGPTFEEGKPETPISWRQKMRNRDEMLAYLKTGERYWFSEEWFGSEKRKTKA